MARHYANSSPQCQGLTGSQYGRLSYPLTGTLNAANLSGAISSFTGTLRITGNDLELVVAVSGCVTWIIETSETLAPGSWLAQVTHAAGNPSATISYSFTPLTRKKNCSPQSHANTVIAECDTNIAG
jgi:hypothetical protein